MVFLIKVSIVILILWTFYKLILERESFFAVNRFYLMACLMLAAVLPFITLPKLVNHQGVVNTWLERTSLQNTDRTVYEPIESRTKDFDPITSVSLEKNNSVSQLAIETNSFEFWMFILYVFGVIVLSVHLFLQLASIYLTVRRTENSLEDSGCTIVNVTDDNGPRSFFRYVFINPEKYNIETYEQILEHERIHVTQKHSIDLLLSEIAIIVLWFNPIVWMFKKEVEKNIEYQTDALLLESPVVEPQSYQMNLLQIGVERKPLRIVSNYNQSLIKKRIVMMNKKKSNGYSYWKYAFIAPTLLITLLVLNRPFSAIAQEATISSASNDIRNIEIGGLVLDADSLMPIEGATIYDKGYGVLAKTDEDGYFRANLDYAKTKGGIYFGFNVGKEGYLTSNQEENWGIQDSKISAVYYIGINKKNSKSDSFSELILNANDSSKNSIRSDFKDIADSIKERREFDKKVEIAKRGNEDVFISIDENFYIVNETGLIELNSKDDLVSIDGKRSISASNLNSLVKRKEIKGMTPLSGIIPFEIYMK